MINQCKSIIEYWLSDIGLELKPSKTRTSHTLNEHESNIGYHLLGVNIRQHKVGKTHSGFGSKGKPLIRTIIKPSSEKIKDHVKRIGDTIRHHKSSKQELLIRGVNPIIKGWCNYNAHCCK